jgi:heat shock protein HslJ
MTPIAAAAEFPYEREMLLDADPMPGTRRVPVIEVNAGGEAQIDLWCNSIRAQFIIAADTVTILTGAKSERQCEPALMRGDDEMLAAFEQVTHWRRDGDILTLRGGKTLRFRIATN